MVPSKLEDRLVTGFSRKESSSQEHVGSTRASAGSHGSSTGRHRSYAAWTVAESGKLQCLVEMYGSTRKWNLIASHVPGRSGKQCRDRWVNHIKGGAKVESWTQEEDLLLAYQHSIVGSKWATIAGMLPGRTAASIKNHWNSTCRSKTLAGKRSFLCAYTTLVQNRTPAARAFQEAVIFTNQQHLLVALKPQLLHISGALSADAMHAKEVSSGDDNNNDEEASAESAGERVESGQLSASGSPSDPTDDDSADSVESHSEIKDDVKIPDFSLPADSLPSCISFPSWSTMLSGGCVGTELSMELRQSLTFDVDSLLASGPGCIDPKLVPELMDDGLVQDLDGPSTSYSMHYQLGRPPVRLPGANSCTSNAASNSSLLQHNQLQLVSALSCAQGYPLLQVGQFGSVAQFEAIQQLMAQSFQLGQLAGRALVHPVSLQTAAVLASQESHPAFLAPGQPQW